MDAIGTLVRKSLSLAVLIIALVLGACGERDNAAISGETDRTLVRGIGGDPETLDPALAEDVHAFAVLIDTFEGLVTENAAGQLVPGVAESWDISEDATTYTFHFRENVRWSNGDPVVASDFVRAMRRVADPQSLSPYASLLAPILNFDNVMAGRMTPDALAVTAISNETLEIRLATPANHFLAVLALPIAFPRHESGDASIGNGAFVIADRVVGARIQARKNRYYRDADAVYFEEVNYLPVVDPMSEFNMFRTGELDLSHDIPDAMVAGMLRDGRSDAHISASLSMYYLAFDMSAPPLDDPSLRQALSMAIDRQAIVTMLGRGDKPAFSVVPPGVSGYDNTAYHWADWADEKRQQQALQLYQAAGYDNTGPLQITLLYDAGGVHERIALAVTAMWRDILGVDASIEKREWKYFLDTRDQRDEWDVMRFAWVGDYNAPNTFLDIFRTRDEQNLAGYSSATYDELLADAARQRDQHAAARILRSAEDVVLNDYPIAPLYFYASKHLVDPSIGGFENNIVDRHPSRFLFRIPGNQ
ncbi:MAG: peptide ABC transporter substrate-binding protein [Woeseiaceae bacterium]